MKRFILAARMAIEGLVGVVFLLNLPFRFVQVVREAPARLRGSSVADFVGYVIGTVTVFAIAVMLVIDAKRVSKRLSRQPEGELAR